MREPLQAFLSFLSRTKSGEGAVGSSSCSITCCGPRQARTYPGSFTGTLSRHEWPQALQTYFVSTAAGCPSCGAILFLPRNTYSRLLHSGQHRPGLTNASIRGSSPPACAPVRGRERRSGPLPLVAVLDWREQRVLWLLHTKVPGETGNTSGHLRPLSGSLARVTEKHGAGICLPVRVVKLQG